MAKMINRKPITPDEDIVCSIDYDNGKSIDIVSVDKHIYNFYENTDEGFECFEYNRDGSGDYEPTGETFKTIEDGKDYVIDQSQNL